MLQATLTPLTAARFKLEHLQQRLHSRLPDTRLQRRHLNEQGRRLGAAFTAQSLLRRQSLAALQAQLDLLAPQRTLERGYAILQDQDGHIVRRPDELHASQRLRLTLAEGRAEIDVAAVIRPD